MSRCIGFLLIGLLASAQQGYHIRVKVKYFPDSVCLLAYHYGNQKYAKDTVEVQNKTLCEFKGKKPLEPGVYLVVMPPKNTYFEFLVTEKEQHFSLETDSTDFIRHMKVKGSKENQIFYDYVRFVTPKRQRLHALQQQLQGKTGEDSVKIMEQIQKINEEIKNYHAQLKKKYPNAFWTKILALMEEPEVPKDLSPEAAYYYYRAHYFDNIDFSDRRLLRTPVFHSRVMNYITQWTPMVADSIIKAVDYILSLAEADSEVFKYWLVNLLNHFAKSKVMGMDAVYAHIVLNYYAKGKAPWVDSTQLVRMVDKATRLQFCLIGKTAQNIYLPDSTGKYYALYDVVDTSRYTILYIWDPDCGHCKRETPKLLKLYEKYKDKGISVYAVYGGAETEKWKKYIRTHKLPWINVHDPKHESYYRYFYDVVATPTIYLIDNQRKIVAKRLDVEQLDKYIAHLLKQKQK